MTSESLEERVAAHIAEGRHVVVSGSTLVGTIPARTVARVSAAVGLTSGPLEEARLAIEDLLGSTASTARGEHEAMRLRKRVLGEHWEPAPEASFVDACNRLAALLPGSALVIDEADALDDGVAEVLAEILVAGESRLPIVFCAAGSLPAALEGPLESLEREGRAARVAARGSVAGFRTDALGPEERRVLRAASVMGRSVSARRLARLLDTSTLDVVEALQRAVDAGAPIADRGNAQFGLPSELVEALRREMLPSLLQLWNLRLADVLASPAALAPSAGPLPAGRASPPSYSDVFESSNDAPSVDAPVEDAPATPPSMAGPDHVDLARRAPPSEAARRAAPRMYGPSPVRVDEARAADHLEAAGERSAAVEALLDAALSSLARGDARRGLALAGRARERAAALPAGDERDELVARAFLREGEVLWYGASVGGAFTLDAALDKLAAAGEQLPRDADPKVRAGLAQAIAGVCFERGDLRSLERALVELTTASRELLRKGHPREAARLLNDQAAVHLRAGDPVRAVHLLRKSRQVFERDVRERPEDATAVAELAETEHLHARLPLHASIRPGRESEAFDVALHHATRAEELYRHLSDAHQLARVWETMGRLELARGEPRAALDRLMVARQTQRQIGDLLGLARTTAALSDVLRGAGRSVEALSFLGDSIAANVEKGSPLGLAYNLRALDGLEPGLPETAREEASTIRRSLLHAAQRFGRVSLPPMA